MAKATKAPAKSVAEKIAEVVDQVVDHVLHPEQAAEAKAPAVQEEAEVSHMAKHKKFDKFKKQESLDNDESR